MLSDQAYERLANFLRRSQMQEFVEDYPIPNEEYEETEDYGYPEMFEVVSSNINSIGFDHDSSTLYVRFYNGSLYVYYGVPEEIWLMFFNSESKGRFLWGHIRDYYSYERVE